MRKLYQIAADIRTNWKNVSPYAAPYLDAMSELESIHDNYYLDSARSVVLYFLSNASGFRGPDAKRIKAELKEMAA
nr:MAG: hypothetical protein [Caudoviricetes sp.]